MTLYFSTLEWKKWMGCKQRMRYGKKSECGHCFYYDYDGLCTWRVSRGCSTLHIKGWSGKLAAGMYGYDSSEKTGKGNGIPVCRGKEESSVKRDSFYWE